MAGEFDNTAQGSDGKWDQVIPVHIHSSDVALGGGEGGGGATGGHTDDELRAAPVPVSGPLTDTQLRATALPVSGPLTDTQLRATKLPVSLADGDDASQGAINATAYSSANGSANGTVIGILKGVYVRLTNALGVNTDAAYASADGSGAGTAVGILKGIFSRLTSGINVSQIGGNNIASSLPVKQIANSMTNQSLTLTTGPDAVAGSDLEAFAILYNPAENDDVLVAFAFGADPTVDGVLMQGGEKWVFDRGLASGINVKGTNAQRFVIYGNN